MLEANLFFFWLFHILITKGVQDSFIEKFIFCLLFVVLPNILHKSLMFFCEVCQNELILQSCCSFDIVERGFVDFIKKIVMVDIEIGELNF